MKIIALILSLLLLTSCSNPDTSGGVTLSRGGGDDANEFPNGSCEGQGVNEISSNRTGCGWVSGEINDIVAEHCWGSLNDCKIAEDRWYIKPGAVFFPRALFDGLDLSGAKLGGRSVLPSVRFFSTNLDDADLSGAYLTFDEGEKILHAVPASFEGTSLKNTNLSGAYLKGAIFWDADLSRADLSGADLRDADLSYADLSGADLSGADLSGVKANKWTTCPNRKKWGTAGNNCGF